MLPYASGGKFVDTFSAASTLRKSRSSGGGSSGGGVTSDASTTSRYAPTSTSLGEAEVDDAKNKDNVGDNDGDGDNDGGDDDTRERVDMSREGGVNGVAWVQGGTYFVSAGDDGVTRVWSSADGSHVRTMDDDPLDERDAGGRGAGGGGGGARGGGAEGVRAVAVVGDKLVTGGTDEFVKVYQ